MWLKSLFVLQKNEDKFLFTSSIPLQIVIGLVSGILNCLFLSLGVIKKVPLFLDTIFVTFASCFGWLSGILSAVVHYLVRWYGEITQFPAHVFLFFLCMIFVPIVIRLYFRKKSRCEVTDIFIVYILLVLAISSSGALIAFLLQNDYIESESLSTTVLAFLRNGTNRFIAYFLARIPNNLIDKAISMLFGFGGFMIVRKIWKIHH